MTNKIPKTVRLEEKESNLLKVISANTGIKEGTLLRYFIKNSIEDISANNGSINIENLTININNINLPNDNIIPNNVIDVDYI